MYKLFKLSLGFILMWLFIGCATTRYDYTIHKPEVKYTNPSYYALQEMLEESDGKPYVWAEEGPSSFDCSGLVYYSFGSMNVWLPRVSREQAKVGKRVSVKNLQYGDLIFFGKNSRRSKVTHVGIYIGNGFFRHASSSKEGIITTRLKKPYYWNRIVVCRRVLLSKSLNKTKKRPKTIKKKKKVYKPFKVKKVKAKKSKNLKNSTDMDSTIALF